MAATTRPASTPKTASALAPFLAADVGGTHVRVGRVQAGLGAARPIAILDYRKYRCADYPSLSAILLDFLAHDSSVSACVIASAGFPLPDGSVITANLPWPLSPSRIREETGLSDVHLVNDFEALAYAAAQVDASEVLQLTGPAQAGAGPMLILGPGTGLGAAVWIPAANGAVVLATEAGQAALATRTELEMALVQQMRRERSHVSVEHALSGPGLMNIYRALCAVRGSVAVHASPDAVTSAATAGNDALATESLDVFCGLLGSTVGDMALLYGIKGGIYLAGGILPQIRDFLVNSHFVQRFLDKGPMREALECIPVKLVEHGQLGVLGAASWYLDRTTAGGQHSGSSN